MPLANLIGDLDLLLDLDLYRLPLDLEGDLDLEGLRLFLTSDSKVDDLQSSSHNLKLVCFCVNTLLLKPAGAERQKMMFFPEIQAHT
jgi:hypothetical protein